eukprot:CAMPEP_0185263382 /NCGR_PEP_ID=MMETSP1359-20130426/14804_1 /TAXON_ID=552665 /ORGANISM="Bigelowiella longifila, Strain CCMP242" /LENGTH=43 /DNA_ID= /DNA_START= /DNA_END= /DNA_ORIENTATION=
MPKILAYSVGDKLDGCLLSTNHSPVLQPCGSDLLHATSHREGA